MVRSISLTVSNTPITQPKPVSSCSRIIKVITKFFSRLIETITRLFDCCFEKTLSSQIKKIEPTRISKAVLTGSKQIPGCHYDKMDNDVHKLVIKRLNGTDILSLSRTSKTEKAFLETKLSKELQIAKIEEAALKLVEESFDCFDGDLSYMTKMKTVIDKLFPQYSHEIATIFIQTILSITFPKERTKENIDQFLSKLSFLFRIINQNQIKNPLLIKAKEHVLNLVKELESEKNAEYYLFCAEMLSFFDIPKCIEFLRRNEMDVPFFSRVNFFLREDNLDEFLQSILSIDGKLKIFLLEGLVKAFAACKITSSTAIEKIRPYIRYAESNMICYFARHGKIADCFLLLDEARNRSQDNNYFFLEFITNLLLHNPKELEPILDKLFSMFKDTASANSSYFYVALSQGYLKCNKEKAQLYLKKFLELNTTNPSYLMASFRKFILLDVNMGIEIIANTGLPDYEKVQLYLFMNEQPISVKEKEANWEKIRELAKTTPYFKTYLMHIALQKLRVNFKGGKQALDEILAGEPLQEAIQNRMHEDNVFIVMRLYARKDISLAIRLVNELKFNGKDADQLFKAELFLEIANELSLSIPKE